YLPLISAGVKEEIKPAKERPKGGTETILLAEDDETVRIMTTEILESAGYSVIAAVDGQDVVNKFKENKDRIELLLFDIIMPKKSGKEAYYEIRAIQPDIKILFQSGYAPDLVRQNLLLEGKMPVVFKPVTPVMLLKQVRSVLDHVT
ncbi:MAG: response regulator, partial [Nitrospirota bacterium]